MPSGAPPGPPWRVGHDLVHVPRFARALGRRERAFRERVFTEEEWRTVGSRPDRAAALAARFAAKEAVMKALGTGWGGGVRWRDVEILGGGRSAPRLRLHGVAERLAREAAIELHVSLSHAGEIASAFALGAPRSCAT